jgi:malonyl-CoA decarboxylase
MPTVNQKLSRWGSNVRKYLFTAPLNQRGVKEAWDLGDFRRSVEFCIKAPFGEVDARHRAAELGAAYTAGDQDLQREVLIMLTEKFGNDDALIDKHIKLYQAADDSNRKQAATALREALKPRRFALLTRFTSLVDGVRFLVDMRTQILELLRAGDKLATLDADLTELFRLWFDPGFLDVQRVTWSSSASLLEKLMEYEANHSIVSWQDLKNRLDGDRRCYTLFHPRMPEEPLAILHVALTRGIASNVQHLLDVKMSYTDPEDADTAVFYSITSPQKGLRGISFGEYLIKQAVKELRSELPDLNTFVTLSPAPGFRPWLEKNFAVDDFANLPFSAATFDSALTSLKANNKPIWIGELEQLLTRKCLQYLTTMEGGRPINPVARFHLRNGAYIHRINLFGDMSENGLRSAAGMMVNYGYSLKHMEENLTTLHSGKLPVASVLVKSARQLALEVEHLVSV